MRTLTVVTRGRRCEAAATLRRQDGAWIVLAEEGEAVAGERWPLIRSMFGPEERVRALVPFALAAALRDHSGPAAFVAADAHVVGPLPSPADLLGDGGGAVLVPRHLDPSAAGADPPFDDGFVALGGEEGERIAEWWIERVLGDGVEVDWLARLPSVSSAVAVLRDAGCAVAPWNLDERELNASNGTVLVNGGAPLRWIRLPGTRAGATELPGATLAGRPELERLVSERAALLADAGAADAQADPEPQETADGLPLDGRLRRLFAQAWRSGELGEHLFTPGGATAFRGWVGEPDPDPRAGGVSRYLFSIYSERRDLQDAYPYLAKRDIRAGFHGWAHQHGADEYGIPPELMPPRPALLDRTPSIAGSYTPPWGVNVVGHFTSKFGLGEAARRVLEAFDAVGMPAVPLEPPGPVPDTEREGGWVPSAGSPPYGVTLLCVNADSVPDLAQEAPELFEGRYTIGLWWWEVEDFPARYDAAFSHIDEVWVGSRHVQHAIAARATVPVFRIAHPVEVPEGPRHSRAELGLPEGFVFLFAYDYNSVARRKNPLGAIEAFERAFEPGAGPQLVLKSINSDADPESHDEVLRRAERRPDIHVMDGSVPADVRDSILASCDAYVSLHRSEGFGQTIAEAMWLGKPVIATDYSGNADYMDAATGYPIPYRLVPIGEGAGPYPPEGHWAEPDLGAAAEAMRAVVDDPGEAARRAAAAASSIREGHSPRVAGESMRARLEHLRRLVEDRARAAPIGSPDQFKAAVESVRHGIEEGPEAHRSPGVRGLFRRLLLRLARPLTNYQRGINQRQLEALEQLSVQLHAETRRAERAAGDLHAAALARLRQEERRGGEREP